MIEGGGSQICNGGENHDRIPLLTAQGRGPHGGDEERSCISRLIRKVLMEKKMNSEGSERKVEKGDGR